MTKEDLIIVIPELILLIIVGLVFYRYISYDWLYADKKTRMMEINSGLLLSIIALIIALNADNIKNYVFKRNTSEMKYNKHTNKKIQKDKNKTQGNKNKTQESASSKLIYVNIQSSVRTIA